MFVPVFSLVAFVLLLAVYRTWVAGIKEFREAVGKPALALPVLVTAGFGVILAVVVVHA